MPARPRWSDHVRKGNEVVLENDRLNTTSRRKDTGIQLDGLALDKYVSIMEMLNPMHRFGPTAAGTRSRGARLLLEEGSFCDVSLDYIGATTTEHRSHHPAHQGADRGDGRDGSTCG